MFGLGKSRTKLGKWLDARGLTQEWFVTKTGFNKNTVSALCGDKGYRPRNGTISKIIKILRKVDPSVRADQFWDL